MCESVNGASLDWSQVGRKDEGFATHVFLEKEHLRVKLQSLAVV
jgi:hypothetical protein